MTNNDKYSQVATWVEMGLTVEEAMANLGIPVTETDECRKAVELKLTGRNFHHRVVNKDTPQ